MKNKNKEKETKFTGKDFIAKNRMIVGIVMLICALLLGVFILPSVANNASTYTVYTVKSNIPSGTPITLDLLTETKTSDKTLAEKAATSKSANIITEYSTKYNIEAGSYLLWSSIAKTDSTGSTDTVPAGKQIISVPVTSIYSSVSYSLMKGDIIRFYSTYKDESNNTLAYIPANLYFVEVFGVYDSAGVSCVVSGGAPASISLVASEAQALDIVTLINTSKVYYSLVSSGDAEKAAQCLAYQEKILKGEINVEDETIDLSAIELSGSVDADIHTSEGVPGQSPDLG